MRPYRHILILTALLAVLPLSAREMRDTVATGGGVLELDTLDIKTAKQINDYTMIGVEYGVTLSNVSWNPTRAQESQIFPKHFGVTWTRYGKMFGYMPYFGVQVGASFGEEGYRFRQRKTDAGLKYYEFDIEGAHRAKWNVAYLHAMGHMHVDFWHLKLIADIGLYGGWRMNMHRSEGTDITEGLENAFADYDHRFDYGIIGGGGLGIVFSPVELHFTALYKYSMSNLFDPDYSSKYYYRWAYPTNLVIQAGIHIQLTRRSGKTTHQLKKEAKNLVYGDEKENNARKSR